MMADPLYKRRDPGLPAGVDPTAFLDTRRAEPLPEGVDPRSAYQPAGGNVEAQVYNGLIQRGMTPDLAAAFVLNFKDESGLNPGINEIAPLVPGSRGGYGLYQLTGPRRRAYEAYAAELGVPLDSVDAQLDFMMTELQGPEARAWGKIQAAGNTGDAAAAIVNHFLRPAESHRAKREARYRGTTYTPPEGEYAASGPAGAPQGVAQGTAQNALAPQQPEPPRVETAMVDPRAFMVAQPNALAFQPFETQRVNYLSGRG
jgi:hypothetical protein